MDGASITHLMGRAEANAMLSLSLHELLIQKDMAPEARMAWVLHLNASANARRLGRSLGIEANVT